MKAIDIDKDYLSLIKRFPLRRIKNRSELEAAGNIFTELGLKKHRSNGENDYYDMIGQLIYQYESDHLPNPKPMSAHEMLLSLMEDNGLTQSELSRQVGCHQSHISDFLSGKRGLSKTTIAKLSARFKLSPSAFL